MAHERVGSREFAKIVNDSTCFLSQLLLQKPNHFMIREQNISNINLEDTDIVGLNSNQTSTNFDDFALDYKDVMATLQSAQDLFPPSSPGEVLQYCTTTASA